MAICVFCGEKVSEFRVRHTVCGRAYLSCCPSCYKEVDPLPAEERCRRALQLGLVKDPQLLEDYLKEAEEAAEVARTAEEHRPACLRCGGKLRFQEEQMLDNSPLRDGLLSSTFDVLPAFCENCGKYEFFNPEVVKKDPYLAHLIQLDTQF